MGRGRTSRLLILGRTLGLSALGIGVLVGAPFAVGQSSPESAITLPDFRGVWRTEAGFTPPRNPSLPGGITALTGVDDDPLVRLGDSNNPILQPHAGAGIEQRNAEMRAGGDGLPNYSLCWPMGVPGALAMADPVLFLQSPDQVNILYQRSQRARQIYLNVPHSQDPKLDWFGESVGHYEGNTLVVDTIALDTRGDLDRFGTPHSEQLHVVERYTLSEDRNTITVEVYVEDPVNFTTPWYATSDYWRIEDHRTFPGLRENETWAEFVCAENNFNVRTGEPYPIPVATQVDF